MKLLPYIFSTLTLLNLGACKSEPRDKGMAEAERNQVFALGAQTIRQFKANGVNSSHYEIKPKGMEDPYQPLTLAFYAYGKKIVTYSTGDVFDGSVAETYADTTIYHHITLIDTLRQDTFIRKP